MAAAVDQLRQESESRRREILAARAPRKKELAEIARNLDTPKPRTPPLTTRKQELTTLLSEDAPTGLTAG